MASIALMTAVLCVVSPFSIPIGPVPVTFSVLMIFLSVRILGTKNGTICVALYLLAGFIGLPVFSGFAGGAGRILGPTGGYLIGYIPMALIAGVFMQNAHEKSRRGIAVRMTGMLLALAVLYILGTGWFVFMMNSESLGGSGGMTFRRALALCVIPFFPFDLIKIVCAEILGGLLRSRIRSTGAA